jgi:hypothetical protein
MAFMADFLYFPHCALKWLEAKGVFINRENWTLKIQLHSGRGAHALFCVVHLVLRPASEDSVMEPKHCGCWESQEAMEKTVPSSVYSYCSCSSDLAEVEGAGWASGGPSQACRAEPCLTMKPALLLRPVLPSAITRVPPPSGLCALHYKTPWKGCLSEFKQPRTPWVMSRSLSVSENLQFTIPLDVDQNATPAH